MSSKMIENTRNWRKTPRGVLTNIYQHQKARANKYGYPLTYSLKYLHSRFLNDKAFMDIFDKWASAGHNYYDKPSIDRKDANLGYTEENIQIMPWRENRIKGDKEVSIKKYRPILMFKNGIKVCRFSSIKEAVSVTGLRQGNISSVCLKNRSHTGGYVFVYENPELLKGST